MYIYIYIINNNNINNINIIDIINNNMLAKAEKAPPIDVTFVILFNPFDAVNVMTRSNITANIAIVFGALNPNIDNVDVLSIPNTKFDNGTHIDEETDTIQIIFDAYHINVTINAYFSPTDLFNHE